MPCPGIQRCRIGCQHRAFVEAYQQERQRLETLAMETARGYRTELREYLERHPLPTFQQWLVASANPYRQEAAA